MKRNFRSPKATFPFSGIVGNTLGQLAQKLPRPHKEGRHQTRLRLFVTFLALYVLFSAKSAVFFTKIRNFSGSIAELCPNPIMERPVAFTFAAATAGNFINSKFRTL